MLDGHPDNASASGVGRSGGPAGGDDSNRSSLNGEQPQQQEQQQVRHSTSLLESQKRATARNLDDSFDSASQSMSRSSWRNSSPGLDLPGTSRQLLHLHSLEQEDEDISSGHRSSEDDDDDEEDESSDPRDAMRAANRADSSEHKADRSVASATHRPLQIGMNRDSSGGLSSLARSLVPPAMAFTTSSSSSVSSASVLPMSSAGSFIAGVGKNRMPSPTRSVRSFRDIVLQRSGSVRSNASANVETRPLSGSSYPQGTYPTLSLLRDRGHRRSVEEFEELLSEKETLQRELHYAAEVGQILLEQNEGLERSLAAANEKVEYLMAALAQVDGSGLLYAESQRKLNMRRDPSSPSSLSGPDSFNEKSQSTALDREEHGMDMLALKYDDLKRDNARLEQELLQAKRSLMIAQKDEEAIRTNMSILSRENEALREDQRALIEGQAKLQEQHSAEINQRAIEANSDNADSQREAREVIQFLTDQLELYRERFGYLPMSLQDSQGPGLSRMLAEARLSSTGGQGQAGDVGSVHNRAASIVPRATYSARGVGGGTGDPSSKSPSFVQTPLMYLKSQASVSSLAGHAANPASTPALSASASMASMQVQSPPGAALTPTSSTANLHSSLSSSTRTMTPNIPSPATMASGQLSQRPSGYINSSSVGNQSAGSRGVRTMTPPQQAGMTDRDRRVSGGSGGDGGSIPQNPPLFNSSSSAGASISATTANAVAAAAAAAAASSSATPSSVAASLSGGATTVGPMTAMTQAPPGFPPNSVNVGSIVRLMVGGWLKKFNRRRSKAERRFVNVNPYSRTLSWSKRDPADEQNTEVNTVYIQAVHIEDLTDGRSRIVIHAPLREIVLECNTPTEHAIWERGLTLILQNQTKASDYLPDLDFS